MNTRAKPPNVRWWRAVRWLALACGLALACFCAPGSGATQTRTEHTRLVVTPAFAGNYVPGTWLPLHVSLDSADIPLEGQVVVQQPGSPNRWVYPLDAQSREQAHWVYVFLTLESQELEVTLEQHDTVVARQTVPVQPWQQAYLLGIAAEQPWKPTLPDSQNTRQPLIDVALPLPDIPDRAAGLHNLAVLLLTDARANQLSEAQQQAIFGWIEAGGHLVLAGQAALEAHQDWLPDQARPAEVGDRLVFDEIASDVAGLPALPQGLAGVALRPHSGVVVGGPTDQPLWVQREVGAGHVTLLALEPAQPALQTWAGAPAMWEQLLRSAGPVPISTITRDQETILTAALANLPPFNLPRFELLLGFLLAYVLCVGPVTAWWLRRQDRRVWGWVVLPALALIFLLGGMGLAYGLHTDQRVITQLSLVEQRANDRAHVRTFTAVRMPYTDQIELEVPPEALLRPLQEASGIYGNVGGLQGDIVQSAGRLSFSLPGDEIQGVLAEQQINLPRLNARLVASTTGIQVMVENTTGQVLREVVVAYGEHLVRLGDLAPGDQQTVPWPDGIVSGATVPPGTALSFMVLGPDLEAGRQPGELPDRQVLVREALINAAVQEQAGYSPQRAPVVLAWLEDSPLPVQVHPGGAAVWEQTLLVARPHLEGNNDLAPVHGWLRPATNERTTCFGSLGKGLSAQPAPVTSTLRLPPDFPPLQTTALTLTMESESDWPNAGVRTRLYDWQQEQWQEIDYDGPGDLPVPNPERYLQQGTLRLGIEGEIARADCLYIEAEVAGTFVDDS